MKRVFKYFTLFLMVALTFGAMLRRAFAEEIPDVAISTPKVLGYQISKSGTVAEGDKIDITVRLINKTILTKWISDAATLSLEDISGSFRSDGQSSISIDSEAEAPLEMTLKFSGYTYSGKGNQLQFYLGYTVLPDVEPDLIKVAVKECVETPPPIAQDEKEPQLQMSIEKLKKPMIEGQNMVLQLTLKNLSESTAVQNLKLGLKPTNGLMLIDSTTEIPLENMEQGGMQIQEINVKVLPEGLVKPQFLEASLKYSYRITGKENTGSLSEKLPVLVDSSEVNDAGKETNINNSGGSTYIPVDSPVPNVIIRKYTFGHDSQVAVGSNFLLALEFFNTSKKTVVENLIITVEPGEGLALNASSNTFFFDVMKKGEIRSLEIPLTALTAKSNMQDVTVTFKYEYVDHRKRTAVTLPQKISIPLYQPDRFEVTTLTLPTNIVVGEEATISLAYYNKGKSEVSNVSAVLEGDINTLSKLQNLGNFESGKSGTIDFIIIPNQAGTATATVKVNYETSTGQEKEKEFPLSLQVSEAVPDETDNFDEMGNQNEPNRKNNLSIIVLIAAGVFIPTLIFIYMLKVKQKKATQINHETSSWEDELDAEEEKIKKELKSDEDA